MKKAFSILALAIAPSLFSITINNSNFESGSGNGNTVSTTSGASALTSWNQYANTGPTLITEQSSDRSIDGNYSARIEGNTNSGLYQYSSTGTGTYTLSAWVYAIKGSAHLILAYNSGSSSTVGASSTTTGIWEFLTVTHNFTSSSLGGPVLYAAENNSEFYIDGLWLNAGSTSTSIYAPSNGFNPNRQTVPDSTATLGLLSGALLVMLSFRRKR